MEGQNEQTLLQLKQAGALQLVPHKMPVYQNKNPEETGTVEAGNIVFGGKLRPKNTMYKMSRRCD